MKKLIKSLMAVLLVLCFCALGMLLAEREALREDMIRLHVVAASDSPYDQAVKLTVRDAVTEYLQQNMTGAASAEEACSYLQENLSALEAVANAALREAGSLALARVSLCQEAFPVRQYETFSLPSGVYQSLRLTIGEGKGQNWWCVVFPSFCLNAASDSFAQTAAGAGFTDHLSHTLAGDEGYELSFFLLDCLGRLENFFHIG